MLNKTISPTMRFSRPLDRCAVSRRLSFIVRHIQGMYVHKSRLQTLVIDCETDDLDGSADFWGAVLGYKVLTRNVEPEDENYRRLEVDPSQPRILVQKVSHPSRVHLDIEADDVDGEVARLERLGARKVEKVRNFWILEAPTGHRFCVVPVQRPDFKENANVWKE